MGKRLQAELKQTKPLENPEVEVFLNTLRTADYLLRAEGEVLREGDLTTPLYNVLRILRGAGTEGLSCGAVSSRMVTRDSDITRLIDRLVQRGLVTRERDAADRRVVLSRITERGLTLLRRLDQPIAGCHQRLLRHLTAEQVRTLSRLLELARQPGS
jgi:DNA-binding MarR family transcriptional regulator